jgi:hypothetical protein
MEDEPDLRDQITALTMLVEEVLGAAKPHDANRILRDAAEGLQKLAGEGSQRPATLALKLLERIGVFPAT